MQALEIAPLRVASARQVLYRTRMKASQAGEKLTDGQVKETLALATSSTPPVRKSKL